MMNLLTYSQQFALLILIDGHFSWFWASSAVIRTECCLEYSRLQILGMDGVWSLFGGVLLLCDMVIVFYLVIYYLIQNNKEQPYITWHQHTTISHSFLTFQASKTVSTIREKLLSRLRLEPWISCFLSKHTTITPSKPNTRLRLKSFLCFCLNLFTS